MLNRQVSIEISTVFYIHIRNTFTAISHRAHRTLARTPLYTPIGGWTRGRRRCQSLRTTNDNPRGSDDDVVRS